MQKILYDKERGGKENKNIDIVQKAVNRINLVKWAKEEIAKRTEKVIVVKADDLVKEMGPEFEKIKYRTLYSALRYILFYNGLKIEIGSHKDGDKVFILSEQSQDEKLPKTLNLEKRFKKKMGVGRKKKKEKYKDEIKNIREEKVEMRKEINKLKKILKDNFDDNLFLVEVFKFNWKTLSWKLVRRKPAKTYNILFDLIKEFTSSIEDRYRFEFTSIDREKAEAKKVEKEEDVKHSEERIGEAQEIGEGQEVKPSEIGEAQEVKPSEIGEAQEVKPSEIGEAQEVKPSDERIGEGKGQEEEPPEIGEAQVKLSEERIVHCPRCGSTNITTFPTIETIRTRSGERKLRHRCKECNEIFGDD